MALVSGLPAGIPFDQEFLDRELWRRQQGYGRGGRMRIERDTAHVLSGVRHGATIGAPIAMTLANRDWANWEELLPVGAGDAEKHKAVASPRPGHADLAGALKYDFKDARYVLERASARESAARVACGAFAKMLLRQLGVEVASHVIRVGSAELDRDVSWAEIAAVGQRSEILLACADKGTETRMKAQVDAALRSGDTVGGVFEVVVHGLPPGIGTHVNWDERLDGLLAQALMSLQAVKAVELGRGVTAAGSAGSAVHDAIGYAPSAVATPVGRGGEFVTQPTSQENGHESHDVEARDLSVPDMGGASLGGLGGDGNFTRFKRERNNAGGVEGGMSNGKDVVVRGYLKPISTLRKPLPSVSFATREETKASYERSDVCVVPAAGVAGEAMVALTVARLVLEKFGGDSLRELKRNFVGYCEQIRAY